MFAERRRFFENLIEQERLAKEKAGIKIKPNPKRIFKPKTSKPLIEEPPKSVSKPKIAFPPKKVSNKIKIIPSLPDRVVWNILDYLDYQQQCKAERVSQRWKKMVRQKQRREIRELTVELTGTNVQVLQQVAFQRLSMTCPRSAINALSGVIRRCNQLLEKLTCDLTLLCLTSQFDTEKSEDWRYFNCVENLWLMVTRISDDMISQFRLIEKRLFTQLRHLTLQIHVTEDSIRNVDILIDLFRRTHPEVKIDIELHAGSSRRMIRQIESIRNCKFNNLSLICSAMDNAILSLPEISNTLTESVISFRSITFREWYVTFDGTTPISTEPISLLRFNSCTVNRSNEMVETIYITWNQRKKKIRREKPEKISSKNDKKVGANKKRVKRPPFLKKLEMAGSCNLIDLNYYQKKAHLELEKRILYKCPTIAVDTSDMCYYD